MPSPITTRPRVTEFESRNGPLPAGTHPTTRLAELELQRPEWTPGSACWGGEEAWRTPLGGAPRRGVVRRGHGAAPGRTIAAGRCRPDRQHCVCSGRSITPPVPPVGCRGAGTPVGCVRQDGDAIQTAAAEPVSDSDVVRWPIWRFFPARNKGGGRLPLKGTALTRREHGHCPGNGAAWPTLGAGDARMDPDIFGRRGLRRHQRGGRVALTASTVVAEPEHDRLEKFLQQNDGGEMLKVETCATCRGYLKSLASPPGLSRL